MFTLSLFLNSKVMLVNVMQLYRRFLFYLTLQVYKPSELILRIHACSLVWEQHKTSIIF